MSSRGYVRRIRARQKKGVSYIIGTVIVFGIFLSVGYVYFYTVAQDTQSNQKAALEAQLSSIQQNQEQLTVAGLLQGSAIGFEVNNSGITATITSYFITDTSTGQLFFNSGTSSYPILPYTISQGGSVTFTTNTFYAQGHSYSIKLLTQRGSIFVGQYPPRQLNVKVANALVAAGLGSISMVFSTYNYYSITSSGGKWVLDLAHPHSASLLPNGVTPAFSIQITNNDPSVGTIILDSRSDMWLYNYCPHGCGTVPLFAFYLVNVATNGTVTSPTKGTFSEISIPYGVTQTVYFASANDISLGNFQTITMSQSHNVALGEYDVFIIISGSDSTATNSVLYAQNLPFGGSFLADNVAWYAESPRVCTHSATATFSLQLNNSALSSSSIHSISLNATSFSSVQATAPSGWTKSINPPGFITWTSGDSGHNIDPADSLNFSWTGTAPSTVGTQSIFLITIDWTGGTITMQQAATGCYTS